MFKMGAIVGYDLLLGRRRRNWARGLDQVIFGEVPTARSSAPSSSSLLEWRLLDADPAGEARFPTIKEKLRDVVPTATRLYEDYQPTYRDHQVVLKMKV
jgi:hypothetical protein